jgi:hypothetical protein
MLGASICFSWAMLLAEQAPQVQPPDLRATGKIVFTPVAVSDAAGKPVHGLQAADFVLYDHGSRRPAQLEDVVVRAQRKKVTIYAVTDLVSFPPAGRASGFRPVRVAVRPELPVRARTGYRALEDVLPAEEERTLSR